MRLAIIGANGFICRHFLEFTQNQGFTIDLYSRISSHPHLLPLLPHCRLLPSDGAVFWEHAQEYRSVIYLRSLTASATISDISGEISANVHAAATFFSKLSSLNPACHIVFPSSGGTIYGPGHTNPITESSTANPASLYGLGKLLIENVLHHISTTKDVNVTILRIANPVGYWQLRGSHGFVGATIKSAISGLPLTVFGDGSNKRDYFDVDDLSELLVKLVSSKSNGFHLSNVGSGKGITEQEVIETIEGLLGITIQAEYVSSRATDLKYAVLNSQKAYQDWGWRSDANLSTTVQKIVDRVHRFGLPTVL